MHLDWILNPLAQYGMLAAGLIACLALFVAVKLELCAVCQTGAGIERCAGCPGPARWSRRWGTSARASPTWKNGLARLAPA